MNLSLKAVLLTSLIFSAGTAVAGVPMDSFNSANAALIPSTAVDRDAAAASKSQGPTDALVRMALGKTKRDDVPVASPSPHPDASSAQ